MDRFLGEIGGLGMIALIVALFMIFLHESGIMKDKKKFRQLGKLSIFTSIVGLIYLLFGGLVYNYSIAPISFFQFDKIWAFGNYNNILQAVQSGISYNFYDFGYVQIVHFLGKLLFGQYVACSFYVSFLFAIIFIWITYISFKKILRRKEAEYLVFLILVMPFSYKLFLPSPISMICLMGSILFYFTISFVVSTIRDNIRFSWENLWAKNLLVTLCLINTFIFIREMLVK